MFYSADVGHERFWRVGISRKAVYAVFFHSFVASKVRKGRSEKRGGAKDRLFKMSTKFAPRLRARAIWKSKSLKHRGFGALLEVLSSTKFAPRLRARAIWKSKSLKTGGVGALLEVELRKNCSTPARGSDLEVKIVKNWHVRSTFGSQASQNLHHACARERFESENG